MLKSLAMVAVASLSPGNVDDGQIMQAIPTDSERTQFVRSVSLLDSSTNAKIIDYPEGYTMFGYEAYYCDYTTNSYLAFMVCHLEFVPGCVAYLQNGSFYNSGYYLGSGSVSVQGDSFSSLAPYGQSGSVTYKACCPTSGSTSGALVSSYGGTLTQAFESTIQSGISLGSIGLTLSRPYPTLSIVNYSWTQVPSFSDPSVSVQALANGKGASLVYSVSQVEDYGAISFSLDFIQIFEVSKGGSSNFGAAFNAVINVSTTGKYKVPLLNIWVAGTPRTFQINENVGI